MTIRGKTWQAQLGKCQNRNSHTSKIVYLLPVRLINNRHLTDHISEPYAKFYRKIVKNCVRNRSRPDEIDTKTKIHTSLKSELYFRFHWLPSTKSTLVSYTPFRVFVMIRGKICPPQRRNWKWAFCTPLESVIYFRFVSETTGIWPNTFPSCTQGLVENGKKCVRNRSIPDTIDTKTEIWTSLKSEFYFRFRWPPSAKSTLIRYMSVRFLWRSVGKYVHHNRETGKKSDFAHL